MKMTLHTVLLVCGALLLLSMAFPPFYIQLGGNQLGCGYDFILSWPRYGGDGQMCRVDVLLLLAQWVFIAAIAGASLYLEKKHGDALSYSVPVGKIVQRFAYVTLVCVVSYALGAMATGYSVNQAFVVLTEFPSVGVATSVQGLVFYAFGYGLAAILARGRLALTKRETSTTIKTIFAIGIGVILAFGAQMGKEAQSGRVSGFIYDGALPKSPQDQTTDEFLAGKDKAKKYLSPEEVFGEKDKFGGVAVNKNLWDRNWEEKDPIAPKP